ncbi:secretin N-terminal domain-containing protein [Candidatus Thiodictyon syntrophicum]|jgi:hypothetical protein|uniref:secretin N-terminal domain-containing protein n=1 Tax=Candidatus Thiodictyon syntrophicum TaxID=1166950 RepID=UPI0012FD27F4|nr:secretin N-terminal domain-containing protein [Candidatus Thiodictyon syntrophicum]
MKTLNCAASIFSRRWAGRWGVPGLLLASLCGGAAADYPLEMIELRARFPEELIPILAPLAGPDGSVVGANNTLFVRASPAHLAEIRRALTTLDRPARSLLIQVRQDRADATTGAGIAVRGDAWDTDQGRAGRPGPGAGRIGVGARHRSASRDLSQEVRALDGHPAFIAIGQERPLAYRELAAGPGGAVIREGSTYQRSESGFYVVPRVQGDQVVIEVATRADSLGAHGSLQTSDVEARVQGRLGDWIPVALHDDTASVRGSGTLYAEQGQRSTQARVELRVLPLD